jgi:pimeloyl-ACP methyl ester carboxylesterase
MFKGEVVNIRTIIFGDEKKPVLVLIHGYGSSGAAFGILAK